MLDFEKNIGDLSENDIQVIAASCDPLEKAQETIDSYKLTFTVGYGLDAAETSALTGAFYDDKEGYLHATGFIVAPDGMIANAVYSTGMLGRLVAADTLSLIKYLREKKQ